MTDNPITQATAALYAHLDLARRPRCRAAKLLERIDLAAEAMGAAGTSTDVHHAAIRRLAAHAMPGPDGTMLSAADLVSDLSRIVGHADVLAGEYREMSDFATKLENLLVEAQRELDKQARAGKPERD